MRIALVGYGKMGKTVEAIGRRQGHSFPLIIDVGNLHDLTPQHSGVVDAAIEFTVPASAPDNVMKCIDLGIPVITGTTGWNDRYEEVDAYCRRHHGTLFRASNFSIGVNILFAMTGKMAGIMNRFPQYKASMTEIHHVHKLDAPSGTAISLANRIIAAQDRVKTWSLETKDDPSVLHIEARREGEVMGIHRIIYESGLDKLSLMHEAVSRDAFAEGALMAALFVEGKKGIYGMEDLLQL